MRIRDHIQLPEQTKDNFDFTTWKQGGGGLDFPMRNRVDHSSFLEHKFEQIWSEQRHLSEERSAISLPTRHGTYIEFCGQIDKDLAIGSLEDTRSGIRLLNVKEVREGQNHVKKVATIYVPAGKEFIFSRKLNDYKTKETQKGKPVNDNLIRSIEDLEIATLHSLWVGSQNSFPDERIKWYEVWIRTNTSDDGGEYECLT